MFLDDILKEIEEEVAQPGGHSDIGASGSERWVNCSASVPLSKGLSDSSGGPAIEGTFYHKLGELMLLKKLGELDVNGFIGEEVESQGHTFKIKENMIEGVLLYHDTIMEKMAADPYAVLSVEMKFCIESLDPLAFGTGDAVLNSPLRYIEVIDLKTGRKPVSPESKQLKYYALGVLEACDTDFDEVRLTIIQPQGYTEEDKKKTFVMTKVELLEFKEELRQAIKRVRSAKPEDAKAGDWCTWCKADRLDSKGLKICPRKREAQDKLLDGFDELQEAGAITEPVTEMNHRVQWCLDNEAGIVTFLKSVREYATTLAKAGQDVPGQKLVKIKTNRAWHPEATDFLEDTLGEEAYKVTKKLLSPAQAENVIKAKLGITKPKAKAMIEDYNHNPDKGVTLVEESDNRPAVVYFEPLVSNELL